MTGRHPLVTTAAEATQQPADPPVPSAPSSWRAESSALGPALLLLVVLLLFAAARGATSLELVTASLTVLITQVFPGVVIWRVVRPVRGWWIEDIALGLAIGAGVAVPSQVVAVATSVALFAWILPLTLAFGLLAIPGLRARILGVSCLPLPRLWGAGVAMQTASTSSAATTDSASVSWRADGNCAPTVVTRVSSLSQTATSSVAGDAARLRTRFGPQQPRPMTATRTYRFYLSPSLAYESPRSARCARTSNG